MAPCFFSVIKVRERKVASPPADTTFLSLCTGEGENRTAAAGGSSWRRGGSDAAPGKRGGW